MSDCDPMDCSPPDSSVYGILQARILEWVAISFSRQPFQPRVQTRVSCIGRWIRYPLSYQGSLNWGGSVCVCVCALSRSVMSNFYDPIDCSLPGSSVPGILQARLLEWVAISSPGVPLIQLLIYIFQIKLFAYAGTSVI